MSPFTKFFVYAVIVADLFAIVIFGGRFILTGSVLSEKTEPKIVVEGAEAAPTTEASTPAAPVVAFDYAAYTPNPTNGASISGKCKACHTFGSGEPNRTGPNLWAIVGKPVTHAEGFAYSEAMVAKKAEWGTWTDEHLFNYLENPRNAVPGTKMQFAGIKKPEDRADLIAYLKTLK